MAEGLRIGVYICHCGVNIAGMVDVEAVRDYALTLDPVAVAREYKFMCSEPGQAMIEADIKELDLNRVVVAACTPKTHESIFQETLISSGLNKYLFEMANIRNQCSWVHKDDKEKATDKPGPPRYEVVHAVTPYAWPGFISPA